MPQKNENIIGHIIQAYETGLQSRLAEQRQLEEQKATQERLKLERERQAEDKRQADEANKIRQEQLKAQMQEAQDTAKYRKLNLDLALLEHKRGLESDFASGKKQFKTQPSSYAEINPTQIRLPYTEQFGDQTLTIDPSTVPTQEQFIERERQLSAAKAEPAMARLQEQNEQRVRELEARMQLGQSQIEGRKFDSILDYLARQQANAGRSGEGIGEEGLEQLIQGGMQGSINIDKLGAKSREKVMIEAGKRGIYLQPEKFKEDSKKLSETANFINLVRQAFKTNPNDTQSLASSVALVHTLNQQIGTLGALFPALGRLSDNDIRILQSGLPTEKGLVLRKIFPKFSTEYYSGLEKALVAGLAKRVEAHLANVPNSEEKHRLTVQYGLYTPGMENYVSRRKQ